MNFEHPFNDRYYEETPFLTARKVMGVRVERIREYIHQHGVKTCVMVFNENLEESLKKFGNVKKIDYVYMGEDKHWFYIVDNILFVIAFMGAPNAACLMEDIADFGIKNFLACGSAGLIDNNFDSKKMLLIDEAVRDEGTSYHYAPPEVIAKTNTEINRAIEKVFQFKKMQYSKGKVWTTDALFRETPSTIDKRIKDGCIGVEMECSAWCIVANYLKVNFGEFVYFSDSVVANEWDWIGQETFNTTTDYITRIAYEIAKEIK